MEINTSFAGALDTTRAAIAQRTFWCGREVSLFQVLRGLSRCSVLRDGSAILLLLVGLEWTLVMVIALWSYPIAVLVSM
jgi:hypothetical protein